MDSKITKKRLYDFLQYEWLKIIGTIAAAIFILYVVFTTLGGEMKKLDAGGRYYLNYAYGLDDCSSEMSSLVSSALSYGVDYTSVYRFTSDGYSEEQLNAYSKTGELDAVIFDDVALSEDEKYKEVTRFAYAVDKYNIWDFESLYNSAKTYAESFLKEETTELKEENISDEAIEKSLERRLKRNGKYKSAKKRAEGLSLEKQRIIKLFSSVNDLERLLTEHREIFREYHKYTALYALGDVSKEDYEKETPKLYGVDLSKLTVSEGKTGIDRYSRLPGKTTAEGTALTIFDMSYFQQEDEYESLNVLSALVRKTTDFLD